MNSAADKIREGRFFLQKMEENKSGNAEAIRYYLQASIVASRGVTFMLQKEFSKVPGFNEWYEKIREQLSADNLASFLLEQRNFILKHGPALIKRHIHLTISEKLHLEDITD